MNRGIRFTINFFLIALIFFFTFKFLQIGFTNLKGAAGVVIVLAGIYTFVLTIKGFLEIEKEWKITEFLCAGLFIIMMLRIDDTYHSYIISIGYLALTIFYSLKISNKQLKEQLLSLTLLTFMVILFSDFLT
jgi:hypothetical protein